MPKQIALTAFAALALAATISSASAGRSGCDDWVCGANGTQMSGIAPGFSAADAPFVSAVILPSNEIVAAVGQLQVAEKTEPKPRPVPKEPEGKTLDDDQKMINFEIQ